MVDVAVESSLVLGFVGQLQGLMSEVFDLFARYFIESDAGLKYIGEIADAR